MDESALRILLANLERSQSSFHWWLEFWTAMVAVGVILEVGFVVWEYIEDLHDFRRGTVHPPERPSTLLLLLGLFGASLVAVGVSGEWYEEASIEHIETKIRQANDALYLLLSKEAGDAAKSAKTAHAEASAAETESGAAKQTAGKAQEEAADVSARAAHLDSQLQDAKAQLGAVDAKRADLEKSLVNLAICAAPRVLPYWFRGLPSAGKSTVDPLMPFAGEQANIEFIPNDAEARRAALEIAGALKAARWNVSEPIPVNGIADGVEIQSYVSPHDSTLAEWQSSTHASEAGDTLLDFLHSYNWRARHNVPTDDHGHLIQGDNKIIPLGAIRIRVGLYPAVAYLTPPGAQEFAQAIAQSEQEIANRDIERDKRLLEEAEESWKKLPPEEASLHRKLFEETMKRRKLYGERYSQPCRPLNPLARYDR